MIFYKKLFLGTQVSILLGIHQEFHKIQPLGTNKMKKDILNNLQTQYKIIYKLSGICILLRLKALPNSI